MTIASPTETVTVTPSPAPPSHFWAGTHLGFTDVLAAINPLQHLPIIGTIYRAVTGDTMGNVARVVGDTLYGGVIGLASGLFDVASIEATGKDVGQHVVATAEDLGKDIGELFHASKPAQAAPDSPSLPALALKMPDPPKLPLMGSATTAGELAAAAPISPLLAPKLVAQIEAARAPASPPPAASGFIRPLPGAPRGIAIDVSDQGIARMRAFSAAHNPQPVALTLPAGAVAAPVAASAAAQAVSPPSAEDFAQRMRDGLAKYDALMATRTRNAAPGTVDQRL